MRIIKIANNQPTGTNPPTSNPRQPAFKMKFSETPRHIDELEKLFTQLETLANPELRAKLESSLLRSHKKQFNGFKINGEHPIVNIKPWAKRAEGLDGNYSGYKVQVTFNEPESGKTLKTSSNGTINRFQQPSAVALNLMDQIEWAFLQMELRVSKEAKKAANSVKKPVQEFIEKMNA